MCEFISFAVDVSDGKFGRIYMGIPNSHGGIERGHGLTPNQYRECEWVRNSPRTLVVRTGYEDNSKLKSAIKAAILSKYPKREDLFKSLKTGGVKWGGDRIPTKVRFTYKDRILRSVATIHFQNGNKKKQQTFENDCEKIRMHWYSDGSKKERVEYRGAYAIRKRVKWYSNGQKKMEITYDNHRLTKTYKRWTSRGRRTV